MRKPTDNYLFYITSHLDRLIKTGTDLYGEKKTSMWMSSIDIATGGYPENDSHRDVDIKKADIAIPKGCDLRAGKRVYRNIDAPKGCSLYWDQPLIVSAYTVAKITKQDKYCKAADEYIKDFLEKCVAENGIFLWGNHYYYDAFIDCTVWFESDEEPKICDMKNEAGRLHEIRPISPAWETFWRISPEATERCIRTIGEKHLFDAQKGGFNRHADEKQGCAFLEAGGILLEALCWLFNKTGDSSLVDKALKIAEYSWSYRNPMVGLPENNPTESRWDKYVCTTEVGLWARCLLRAYELSKVSRFAEIAEGAIGSYLRFGYSAEKDTYYGRLSVKDGKPMVDNRETIYQPGDYTDIWEPLFPIHDYPMTLAESCLGLYRLTGEDIYKVAIDRWAGIIEKAMPARSGIGAYAEHYGRCIHFLAGAAILVEKPEYKTLAKSLAQEAVNVLFYKGMFRGHSGEDRYDAVDGVGFLMLALIYLETGEEPDYMGFGF